MTAAKAINVTHYETVGDTELIITRSFEAPRELVFAAWTEPEHLKRWLGPARNEMTTCEVDLRVGGSYRYVFTLANGGTMGMGGTYTEVDAPERLVATEQFDDYPGESVNTIVLTEQDGITTCVCSVVYNCIETRDGAMASGMKHGIDEGYDRLDDLVAALEA